MIFSQDLDRHWLVTVAVVAGVNKELRDHMERWEADGHQNGYEEKNMFAQIIDRSNESNIGTISELTRIEDEYLVMHAGFTGYFLQQHWPTDDLHSGDAEKLNAKTAVPSAKVSDTKEVLENTLYCQQETTHPKAS